MSAIGMNKPDIHSPLPEHETPIAETRLTWPMRIYISCIVVLIALLLMVWGGRIALQR